MKTNHHPQKTETRGMTFLESVVVIFVLIAIITTLFAGARAWKSDSDRTACINNIASVQHAIRAFQARHRTPDGALIDIRFELVGPGRYLDNLPYCPAGGSYQFEPAIPRAGSLAVTCSLSDRDDHTPNRSLQW